eukprot:4286895-Pleurochrysis_carterae.AAC.1
MAARLWNEANLGGWRRASSTRARLNGASPGPSVMRPPEGGVSPAVGAPVRDRASVASSPSAPHAPSSASAMA